MKIGSIVECVNDSWKKLPHEQHISGPKRGNYYTVSGFQINYGGRQHLSVYEFDSPVLWCMVSHFREIEFPPAFEQELKEIVEQETVLSCR